MRRTARSVVSIIAACLLAAGCATMTPNQCRTTDWARSGHEDGFAGYSRALFERYVKACAGTGAVPDAARWNAGYERGNAEYCTPQRGFEEGLRDSYYRGVCAAVLEPAFLDAFGRGRAVQSARRNLAEIQRDLSSVQGELRRRDLRPGEARALAERLSALRIAQRDAEYELARIESLNGFPAR